MQQYELKGKTNDDKVKKQNVTNKNRKLVTGTTEGKNGEEKLAQFR